MGPNENEQMEVQPVPVPEVITFRRKKLDWPGVVTARDGDSVTVEQLNIPINFSLHLIKLIGNI